MRAALRCLCFWLAEETLCEFCRPISSPRYHLKARMAGSLYRLAVWVYSIYILSVPVYISSLSNDWLRLRDQKHYNAKIFILVDFILLALPLWYQKKKKQTKQNKKQKQNVQSIYKLWQGHRNGWVANYFGPRNKTNVKEGKQKHFTCSTLLVRLEILWSCISNRWF